MGLLSIATLPARAAIAGAELVVATGRLAVTDGRVRRPGGYKERIRVLLSPGGAIEQLGRLGDPAGPEVGEPLTRLAERLPGRARRAG